LFFFLSIKSFYLDPFDAYIVVSFINATLVLSIGETVEEVTDSGFLGTTPTLSCSQLGDDSLLQVCVLMINEISTKLID
jgi:splicing factor 3B subunit 3